MNSDPSKTSNTPENLDSLNAKRTVARSLSIMKIRLINYLNKVDDEGDHFSRFGSCNEFTMGIHHGSKIPNNHQPKDSPPAPTMTSEENQS